MPDLLPADVPEEHRDRLLAAVSTAFGPGEVSSVETVAGGASGALTYRAATARGAFLVRAETLTGPMRNPHQYACMQLAADAGIAPPVRYVDSEAGIAVLTWIDQRPLADRVDAVAAGGNLLARLHDTPGFPERGDHLQDLAGLVGHLQRSGRVAPGLLDRHVEGFERLREAYPWDPATHVSAHNDPNQFNLLCDGERLWLIDWETAKRNDPHIDVATMASHLAPTPSARDALLRAWLGREPNDRTRAITTLAHHLVELFAGTILLVIVVDPAVPTHTDLTPMSLAAFGTAIERGELVPGTPAATHAYAKIALGAFADALASPEVEAAMAIAAR